MKKMWKCEDGPWRGYTLYLDTPCTAWFTLHGVVGRYAYGKYYLYLQVPV